MNSQPTRFVEKQYFWEQPLAWLAWLMFLLMIGTLFFTGQLEGLSAIIIGVSVIFIVFVMLCSMTTEIDKEQIQIKMTPFHRAPRVYKWSQVSSAKLRKYKPMSEYGGWGIRFGPNGKAYNVSGSMGLQLEFDDGKRLLIGTRKPDELKEVLKALNKWSVMVTFM